MLLCKKNWFKKVDFNYSAPLFYSGSPFKCVIKNVKYNTTFSYILFVVVNVIMFFSLMVF
jgi:hypothetical protein